LDNDPRGVWTSGEYVSGKSKTERPTLWYAIKHPKTGEDIWPDENAVWRYSKEKHEQMVAENRLHWGPNESYQKPRIKRFLSEIQDGVVPPTWWTFEDVGHNDEAQKETGELLGKKIFSTPKPIRFIRRILDIATSQNDIVVDFFAGSGSTAHAVLNLNEQDGGDRQFICVQMPEALEETSEAYKAGYRTIAEICKARITKAIAKLQAKREATTQNADLFPDTSPKQALGFNSFKIAPSNFKKWRSDTENQAILEQLDLFRHSEKQTSENKNLLVELLLKSGRPLTAKVETITIDGQDLYNVESGSLLLFFDDYNCQVKALIFKLKPKRVVCLDRVFKNNDEALTNFQLNLKDAGIELQII
jgi:adenine-specific DNA-methyltransferase